MSNIPLTLETRHCPHCNVILDIKDDKNVSAYWCNDCKLEFITEDTIVHSWTRNDTLSVPSEVQGPNLEQIEKEFKQSAKNALYSGEKSETIRLVNIMNAFTKAKLRMICGFKKED